MQEEKKTKLYEFIERMPKVELHVHLEGSIKPETILMLAQRNNIALPAHTVNELIKLFTFKNFTYFYEIYKLVTSCLKTVNDYELIAYQFGSECKRQNIRYAEVTFSIFANCQQTGLSWEEILDGLNRGREHARKEFGVDWGWIFDIVRDQPESQDFVLDAVIHGKDKDLVALGLTNEDIQNPNTFAQTFARAHKNNCPTTIHVGETGTSDDIWTVLDVLAPDRIGHGVACAKDPKLVEFLKQKQIPLEICPTSNICIGIFPSFAQHPLRKLWDAGLLITVNSDDPVLFNTDLNNEYKILVDHFGFNLDELEKISLNAVYACFLDDNHRQKMSWKFKQEFLALRKEHGLLAGGK